VIHAFREPKSSDKATEPARARWLACGTRRLCRCRKPRGLRPLSLFDQLARRHPDGIGPSIAANS
jgi:hypothetical protein